MLEAYTGNHIGCKGDRTPLNRISPESAIKDADGDVFNGAEANTKESFQARFLRSAGVRRCSMYGEKCQELGRPDKLLRKVGKPIQPNEGRLMVYRESDQLIVL